MSTYLLPLAILFSFCSFWAFIFTWQQMHFIKNDFKLLEKKYENLSDEIYILKYQPNESKIKDIRKKK